MIRSLTLREVQEALEALQREIEELKKELARREQ
jgi:sugar-specific transcriptional regulator TrmB